MDSCSQNHSVAEVAMHWECRLLTEKADFEQVVDLEIDIWKLEPRDAVPINLLHAMASNGSLVAGAYDSSELIGMALAFPTLNGNKRSLWSHMTGVLPEYQGQGVGFVLKQFQRTWALEHGYNTIKWTFDPLQRGNANFNLHLLGATANIYHVDYYGMMTDGINAGLPSDRLEVNWNLRSPRVKKLSMGMPSPALRIFDSPDENLLLLSCGKRGQPIQHHSNGLPQKSYLVEIPVSITRIKQTAPQIALEWRLALRAIMESVFKKGFLLVDFLEFQDRSYYLVEAPTTWYLYLLSCSDGTLYTGITPDLQARIRQHNTGRGAKYTAVRLPVSLKGAWQFPSHSLATKAEFAFKGLSRQKKLQYVENQLSFHESPFIPPD